MFGNAEPYDIRMHSEYVTKARDIPEGVRLIDDDRQCNAALIISFSDAPDKDSRARRRIEGWIESIFPLIQQIEWKKGQIQPRGHIS